MKTKIKLAVSLALLFSSTCNALELFPAITTANMLGTVGVSGGGTGVSSYTTNSIPYYDGTVLNQNNSNLNWNNANTRLSATNVSANAIGVSGLTASQAVVTNGNKDLSSLQYTPAATASTLMSRDSNVNTSVNILAQNGTINSPSSTTTVNLTASSSPIQYLTTNQTLNIVLPDATTLPNFTTYQLSNLTSGGSLYFYDGASVQIGNIGGNMTMKCQLQSNSTVAGTWKIIMAAPANGTSYVQSTSPFGSSPNSSGLTISGRYINLQPANASFGGAVSASNQTLSGQKTFTNGTVASFSTLTDAATVTPDFSTANNFNLTLGGNRTLGFPSNPSAGQSGVITVRQDITGSRTLAYAWPYMFVGGAAPTLSTGKLVIDQLNYVVNAYSTSNVTVTIASPAVMTWTGHGLVSGQKIQLTTTGSLPTGLSANTTYWVTVIDANTFNLSTSLANAQSATFINTSGTQSGTHTATNISITLTLNPALS